MKLLRQEAPGSLLARMAPWFAAMTVLTGIVSVVLVTNYYLGNYPNYLTNNDPFRKGSGFATLVETADNEREKIGATWFATTDYRIYSMLRWHLKDQIPVVQINERNRYIGFREPELGPVGLYIASNDQRRYVGWDATTAVLEPLATADLTWRGFTYDTYLMEKLSGWKPVLSPPPGDPIYASRPH